MKLQIFQEEVEIDSEKSLRNYLKYRHDGKFGAFWLNKEKPVMALFINSEKACLYYMPELEEDKWAKNVSFEGNEEDTVSFLIDNYQQDDICEEMVIPTNEAVEAFVYFFNTGKLSNAIKWF